MRKRVKISGNYLEDKRKIRIFTASNISLATPLSAGSKTLSPLLHLKVTSLVAFIFHTSF